MSKNMMKSLMTTATLGVSALLTGCGDGGQTLTLVEWKDTVVKYEGQNVVATIGTFKTNNDQKVDFTFYDDEDRNIVSVSERGDKIRVSQNKLGFHEVKFISCPHGNPNHGRVD